MRSIDLYAQAFFNALEADTKLDAYYDLCWLKELPTELISYYSSLVFQGKNRDDIYQELKDDLYSVVSDITVKFITILVEDGFLNQINEITDYYLNQLIQEKIAKKATIISAEELSQEFKKELEYKVKEKYHLPVIFEYIIDVECLGGIRIELDDAVIDTSYRTRLKQIVSEGLHES